MRYFVAPNSSAWSLVFDLMRLALLFSLPLLRDLCLGSSVPRVRRASHSLPPHSPTTALVRYGLTET